MAKVHLVKAMIIPVAMCDCESWPIKKSELSLLNCGVEKDVESSLDYKEIKPVNSKVNQS